MADNAQGPKVALLLHPTSAADLERSGLSAATIQAAGITQATDQQLPKAAIERGWRAYAIPYHQTNGQPIRGHQRLRLLPGTADYKYHQTSGENHLYIAPPALTDPVMGRGRWAHNVAQELIITEGEKKALAGLQAGFPTLGIAGVNSWVNHVVKVERSDIRAVGQGSKAFQVRLDPKQIKVLQDGVAEELVEINWEGRTTRVILDSDARTNDNIMDAALDHCNYLEDQGAEVIFYVLPDLRGQKTGLDDFLIAEGASALEGFLETEGGYPYPTRPKSWVKAELGKGKANRDVQKRVARGIVAHLDSRGSRFKDAPGSSYFFDKATKQLHTFSLAGHDLSNMRGETFGTLLLQQYGLGTSDDMPMKRLADAFTGINPIDTIQPRTIAYSQQDVHYLAISDSRFARVTTDGVSFHDNGTDGVLFRSLGLEELSEHKLRAYIDACSRSLWPDVLKTMQIVPMSGLDLEETRTLLSCQFHLSPWLRGWRGMSLPVEIATGEPGSGKSMLFNFRKMIYRGAPSLDHAPKDIKDWYAVLVNGDGQYVGDNVGGKIDRLLQENMSDEMARLTSEPNPSVEVRKLYTTMSSGRFPIDTTFAITTIDNPFNKPDLLQRAIMWHMSEIPEGQRDGSYYTRLINNGGRELWVANQLWAAVNFLRIARSEWDDNYRSQHRLIHYEQALMIMGGVLGYTRTEMKALMVKFSNSINIAAVQNNRALEALALFVSDMKLLGHKQASFEDIVLWANGPAAVGRIPRNIRELQSEVALGRFFSTFAHTIERSVGLVRFKTGNKTWVRLIDTSDEPTTTEDI